MLQVLPTSVSKAELWRQYKTASPPGQRVVRLSSFRSLWTQLVPYVVVGRPMSLHSFSVTADAPDTLVVRDYSDSPARNVVVGKGSLPKGLRPIIRPQGLSMERQNYLYGEIREFCREGTEDLVCPPPTTSTMTVQPEPEVVYMLGGIICLKCECFTI